MSSELNLNNALPKFRHIPLRRQRNGGCVGCAKRKYGLEKWQILPCLSRDGGWMWESRCVWETCELCNEADDAEHYIPMTFFENILNKIYVLKHDLCKMFSPYNIELMIRKKIFEFRNPGKELFFHPHNMFFKKHEDVNRFF